MSLNIPALPVPLPLSTTIGLSLGFILLALKLRNLLTNRTRRLPRSSERVLILGASSGVGRALAEKYAELGVKGVCIVGRRVEKLEAVVKSCESLARGTKVDVFALGGDFAEVGDMVRVKDELVKRWGGIDTLIVAAGVSALRPLLDIAKDVPEGGAAAIQHVVDISAKATRGNFIGPLVAAVTFIPVLESTSKSPSILLINTLASAISAPTRALYGSTKAASLHMYQSLAIEHPKISFTQFLPYTIEGDFRAGAVDGGAANVREADPNKHGLKLHAVVKRCVRAVDGGEQHVFMPGVMGIGHLLYWVWPGFISRLASRKYRFTPEK